MSRIVGALIAFLVARFILRAIYRVYFHPLSKYPGPKLYAATRIPMLISILNGSREKVYADLHRKYGPIVRLSHDELIFIDPDAWKDIYGHGTRATPGKQPFKDLTRYGKLPNNTPSILITPEEDHARIRKIFTPAFSDRALKQQEPLFLKYINKLMSRLRESVQQKPSGKLDLVQLFNFTTFDIMGDLTFGESLHMLDTAEYDPWVSSIFKNLKNITCLSVLRYYPLVLYLFRTYAPPSVNKKETEHFNHSATRVTKRLEKGTKNEGVDIWDLVLKQKEGKGLSRSEMDSNASLFMIAGTETTATLLSGLTYLLMANPACMQQLNSEIRTSFDSDDDMTMERLAALPYLNACIKEAFRYYPPVPISLPRRVPAEGSTVAGNFVPPGSIVGIPQRAMYTSETNFKRATEFLPQRWLGDAEFEADAKHCLQPFSVGNRDCVGKNMAYHEIRLVAAKLYFNFDLALCPESADWIEQKTYVLWEKKPLMCQLRAASK